MSLLSRLARFILSLALIANSWPVFADSVAQETQARILKSIRTFGDDTTAAEVQIKDYVTSLLEAQKLAANGFREKAEAEFRRHIETEFRLLLKLSQLPSEVSAQAWFQEILSETHRSARAEALKFTSPEAQAHLAEFQRLVLGYLHDEDTQRRILMEFTRIYREDSRPVISPISSVGLLRATCQSLVGSCVWGGVIAVDIVLGVLTGWWTPGQGFDSHEAIFLFFSMLESTALTISPVIKVGDRINEVYMRHRLGQVHGDRVRAIAHCEQGLIGKVKP